MDGGVYSNLTTGRASVVPRVMPFGDSISYGVVTYGADEESGGYRAPLWDMVAARDLRLDFVGGLRNGPDTLPDRDHQGMRGKTIAYLNQYDATYLAAAKPDVVLLMIGTNDTRTRTATQMIGDLRALLVSITNNAPDALVLVSTIPPVHDAARQRVTDAYNAAIPGLVASLAGTRKVGFVDMRDLTPADVSAPPADTGVHPTREGYLKIAGHWLAALDRVDAFGSRDLAPEVADLIGGARADRLIGDARDNRLEGLGGADHLDGGAGADMLIGGAGDDTYIVDDPRDVVVEAGGGGADTVIVTAAEYALAPDASVETMLFTAARGVTGRGSGIANRMAGTAWGDRLSGEGGDDRLEGMEGDDQLDGGAGRDRLDGGTGADLMTGGAGDDTYVVDQTGDRVAERAGEGTDLVLAAVDHTLAANVENLTLTGLALSGSGNALANRITGNVGGNALAGLGGNDTLDGGAGRDTLTGGAGDDRLIGGDALDVAVFAGVRADYAVATGSTGLTTVRDLKSTVDGADGTDTVSGVERLRFKDGWVLLAANRAPVAGDDHAAIGEDGALAGPPLLANDGDGDLDALTVAAVAGSAADVGRAVTLPSGATARVAADGAWTYVPGAAWDHLRAGETGVDRFTYEAADGFGGAAIATVTITIAGANDPATLGGTATARVVAGAPGLGASGALTVADPDAGEAGLRPATGVGSAGYGAFTVAADGGWQWTATALDAIRALGAGATAEDSFTARALDGTAEALLTVTIEGVDDPGAIGGVRAAALTEDDAPWLTAAGALTADDPDPGDAVFVMQDAAPGVFGAFTLTAEGAWTYAADGTQTAVQALGAGAAVTDRFTARTAGGAYAEVSVTITGVNDAPVIGGDDSAAATVAPEVTAGGRLTIADPDSGESAFQPFADAPGANGYGRFALDAAGAWTYLADGAQAALAALAEGETVTDRAVAWSLDGGGWRELVVTIVGAATPPDPGAALAFI